MKKYLFILIGALFVLVPTNVFALKYEMDFWYNEKPDTYLNLNNDMKSLTINCSGTGLSATDDGYKNKSAGYWYRLNENTGEWERKYVYTSTNTSKFTTGYWKYVHTLYYSSSMGTDFIFDLDMEIAGEKYDVDAASYRPSSSKSSMTAVSPIYYLDNDNKVTKIELEKIDRIDLKIDSINKYAALGDSVYTTPEYEVDSDIYELTYSYLNKWYEYDEEDDAFYNFYDDTFFAGNKYTYAVTLKIKPEYATKYRFVDNAKVYINGELITNYFAKSDDVDELEPYTFCTTTNIIETTTPERIVNRVDLTIPNLKEIVKDGVVPSGELDIKTNNPYVYIYNIKWYEDNPNYNWLLDVEKFNKGGTYKYGFDLAIKDEYIGKYGFAEDFDIYINGYKYDFDKIILPEDEYGSNPYYYIYAVTYPITLDDYTYSVLEGDNQEITDELNEFTFRIDGNYNNFLGLRLDGVELILDTDYTIEEGSTIVKFREAGIKKLKKLANGKYTITVDYKDHRSANIKFALNLKNNNNKPKNDPDDNPSTLDIVGHWKLLSILSLGGVFIAAKEFKKIKNRYNYK